MFPADIASLIFSYTDDDKLRDWVDEKKLNWSLLPRNPNAIHILEKNLDKVNWDMLSMNPNAIHILEKNLDKVDWKLLSGNPNAIHMLEKKLAEPGGSDEVDWEGISMNPSIFIRDKRKKEVLLNLRW